MENLAADTLLVSKESFSFLLMTVKGKYTMENLVNDLCTADAAGLTRDVQIRGIDLISWRNWF